MKRALAFIAAAVLSFAAAAQEPAVKVLAAGSLRAALTDVARAFEAAAPGRRVELGFGASGLLKDRLAAGERADVFASANMEHPQALADAGKLLRRSASDMLRMVSVGMQLRRGNRPRLPATA